MSKKKVATELQVMQWLKKTLEYEECEIEDLGIKSHLAPILRYLIPHVFRVGRISDEDIEWAQKKLKS